MKKHYIKAVLQLLEQGLEADAVLQNLKRVLAEKGHDQLYVQILKGVQAQLLQQQSNTAAVITVAKAEHADQQKAAIEAALLQLGGTSSDAIVAIDPTLIGGFVASFKGKSSNHSYKEKLITLYNSITK